jgi:Rod binding domain-containing protein
MTDTNFALQAQTALMAGTGRPPKMAKGANMARMRETAEEFEAFYISQALQPMFENLTAAEPFGGGSDEGLWRSFQVQEYGKSIARAGGIGLADEIVRQMIQMQEQGQGQTQ